MVRSRYGEKYLAVSEIYLTPTIFIYRNHLCHFLTRSLLAPCYFYNAHGHKFIPILHSEI